MAKVEAGHCQHRNLHRGRFDFVATYCLDCERQVSISVFSYASGKKPEDQDKEALALCEADPEVTHEEVPHA